MRPYLGKKSKAKEAAGAPKAKRQRIVVDSIPEKINKIRRRHHSTGIYRKVIIGKQVVMISVRYPRFYTRCGTNFVRATVFRTFPVDFEEFL